ncbi:PREDICTED: uncharacterized protein LOC104586978 [Nelumbo nucifera]|uniref:Uncharacterized protein LOC104586978 n=2 Tax=Nelumbo nucifera TaxID=4432 RepID=A0A1U7YRA7_NELNU|nr:PREDICTED: uncharacterized protein LOC104586978 [Nelumbo nucifera]DAD24016.1 TPA_asm: hypothetical protein HUJ06_025479 [Nelumbo nucifera]
MSELCFSSSTNTNFYSLLLSDFIFFCSFILSHPLYFSYFIFFFPYLLKLFSFLSPLFITTFLLLLAFLTISPGFTDQGSTLEASGSKVGLLISSYHKVLDTLRSRLDNNGDEFHLFEELEAFIVVFDTTFFKVGEYPIENSETKIEETCSQAHETQVINPSGHQAFGSSLSEVLNYNVEENPLKVIWEKSKGNCLKVEGLLQETVVEDKRAEPPDTVLNKVKESQNNSPIGTGPEALSCKASENPVKVINSDNGGEYHSKEFSSPLVPNLGSFGSMRKEKEWSRTLACKLYEERQNVDEEEGMDLLWEAYEADSGKAQVKNRDKKEKKEKKEKKCGVVYDEDEEDEEDMEEQLCCLQALRFSTGKMNLGMGRTNFVRISKALKGIGWLHHVSRHGKKG